MAMREPEASCAGDVEPQVIPDDHPVRVSFRSAPLDDEPETEAERLAVAEWRANPVGVDSATVSAMIAGMPDDEE